MTTEAIDETGSRSGQPLERSTTLPPHYFTDPAIFNVEKEVIFSRTWICVGREDQVAEPGDFFRYDLVGTPLIIVRGKDGALRALSASCLHRFMPVVEGSGNRTSFQCQYHLWTYGLDGQLIGAPEMERAEGFEMRDCRLPEARLETWEGFIFVNLDANAEPLGPQLASLSARLRGYRLASMRTAAILDYDSPWNWKVMLENGLESYHHIGIHRDTLEPFFPAHFTSHEDVDGPYVYHHIPTKDSVELPAKFAVPDDLPDEQRRELLVVGVMPVLMLALQPDEMNFMQIIPGETAAEHRVRWWICYRPDAWDDPAIAQKIEESKAILDAVHRQDIDACEAVWRGLQSRFATPGRLSHLEKGVWQFDEWVRERIAEAS